jgi:hypothetical protein
LSYGANIACVVCTEYREHFQVLASVVSWHAGVSSKDEFAAVLEHLFSVCHEATLLILDVTTARALHVPSNLIILFRAHARLQVGSVAGVNAVSRGADLPRYLAFARSVQTLDPDPNFGFLWNAFLLAVTGRTLTPVNPRPCLIGPVPLAQPAVVVPQGVPFVGHLDVHAAEAVNSFVNAWDVHHQNGIRDGRIQELGAVARVEFPAGARPMNPPVMAQNPGGGVQHPAQVAQAAHAVNPQAPFVNQALPPIPGAQYAGQYSPYGQGPLPQAQQYAGQQHSPMFTPPLMQHQPYYPYGGYYNQPVQQPQFGMGQQFHMQSAPNQHFGAGIGPAQQHFVPAAQQFQVPLGLPLYPQQMHMQPNPQFPVPHAPLHDFSFFPPNHSMNGSSAAQLGKSATIAGAHNTWLRKSTFSVSVKIHSYPRGAEGSDGKGRSRPFDIPYVSNSVADQYLFITDEPVQISQRELILICFLETCVAWARYILPLTGNDPLRLPIHGGQMTQVLANIRELAHTFGTSESVVLRVCHCISERNIASCLNPGDSISLQDPLDVSTNYFHAALSKFMFDHRNHLNAPQQNNRRPLAVDGDPPARQEGAQQRQRPNNLRRLPVGVAPVQPPVHSPPLVAGAVMPVRIDHAGKCNRFWAGHPCYIHQTGQPCPYRHVCRTCRIVVSPSEAAAHLQSHL